MSRHAAPALADTTGDSAPLKRCCGGDTGPYKDFGEKVGIERLMRDFMEGLLADPRTRPFFERQNKERIILETAVGRVAISPKR